MEGLGRESDADAWVISSESCSFQSIGARFVREVLPGEIVELSKDGVKTLDTVGRPAGGLPAFCIFEFVYFSRPDTIYEGALCGRVPVCRLLWCRSCRSGFLPPPQVFPLSFPAAGQTVYSVRKESGRMLWRESPVEADIVSSVPESGTAAAHGFAREVRTSGSYARP